MTLHVWHKSYTVMVWRTFARAGGVAEQAVYHLADEYASQPHEPVCRDFSAPNRVRAPDGRIYCQECLVLQGQRPESRRNRGRK